MIWPACRSSSLFQRRRDFEREREADAKDRQREQQEIEELKKQILAENENIENADEEARRRHQEQVGIIYMHLCTEMRPSHIPGEGE